MSENNIQAVTLKEVLANPDRNQALEDGAKLVLEKAEHSIAWYDKAIANKRRGAVFLRLGAVSLGCLATIAPMVVSMLSDGSPELTKSLLPLSGIFGVLAASFLVLDKLFGFSSGWMRYVQYFFTLQALKEGFEIAWARERLKRTEPIDDEHYLAGLELIAGFARTLGQAIQDETKAWVDEFKGAITETNAVVEAVRAAAAKPASPVLGGIEVSVEGVDQLEGKQWSVRVDEGALTTRTGAGTMAIPSLQPGLRRIVLEGSIGSTRVVDERIVAVEAGKVAQVRLKVPTA